MNMRTAAHAWVPGGCDLPAVEGDDLVDLAESSAVTPLGDAFPRPRAMGLTVETEVKPPAIPGGTGGLP